MSFAILRIAKLKTAGGAGALSAHLERTMDVPNADLGLRHLNKRLAGSGDLWQDIKKKLDENDIKEVRKNGVYAIELLMTASPEHFNFHKVKNEDGSVGLRGNLKNWNEFNKGCQDWLVSEFGKSNVVNYTIHLDEETPHIHAVIVPLIDNKKKTKVIQKPLKDAFGIVKGFIPETVFEKKLSAKSFIDGRATLRGLQDSFAKVHQASGLKRGLEGSKAKHTEVKDFYASIKDNPSLKDETLKLINQRANKKETLTEKRLKKLETIMINQFGHRPEWEQGKDTGFLVNIEEEKKEKEKQAQAIKNQSIFLRNHSR